MNNKCEKCGMDFEGNSCPNCGTEISVKEADRIVSEKKAAGEKAAAATTEQKTLYLRLRIIWELCPFHMLDSLSN